MENESSKRFFPYNFKTGKLLARPNRFVVFLEVDGTETGASLPNPGKLGELFIPGARLYVQKMGSHVKYPYRVMAVESESGEVIMLDTHMTNRVAEYLVKSHSIPSLASYSLKKREVSVGHSRFDLLLENEKGEELYCEVKSSTLFAGDLAMFPDAVTSRGTRHIQELTQMSRKGIATAVLFVVQSDNINYFSPDYHTDPAFSKALYDARDLVRIIPCTAGWDKKLSLIEHHREIPVLWKLYESEGRTDRGIFIMQFKRNRKYVLYISFEEEELVKRVERYKRKKTNPKTVLERLRHSSGFEAAWTIRGPISMKKEITKSLSSISLTLADENSDYSLFFSDENPRLLREFQNVLLEYRMVNPVSRLKN
ncbi:MAG: DNA/RNA nuclease SfsA [Spirochaetales bacterium]|nr:DNA/RNA nuclease SfsA [Spirochaetales bacterium]